MSMSTDRIPACAEQRTASTLSAWRDGLLAAADARRLEQHIAACAACRARLADYDALAAGLRTLQVPAPVGGYGRNPRLWPSSRRSTPPAFRRSPASRPHSVLPGLGALAAAFLVVVLTLVLFVPRLGQLGAHPEGTKSTSTRTPVAPTQSATPAIPALTLTSLHMIDATTGWATTSTSLLRTTTGWRTWTDVTPHKAALVGAGYFLSGDEAWIGEASGLSLQPGQQPAVIIAHTTNGGHTWQSAPLAVTVPEGVFSMSFINAQDGWSEAAVGGAAGTDLVKIFRTTNGGTSWTAVSDFPVYGHKNGLVFLTTTTGWATSAGLYVTHDGGVTWHAQALPTPPDPAAGRAGGLPIFFTSHDGLLAGDQALLVTHDSGSTWQTVSGATLPASVSGVTFVDLLHGWASDTASIRLYRTSDGGVHWVAITSLPATRIAGISQLDFVSPTLGWAWGASLASGGTLLFTTTDGGQTWTQVPLTS
jgi:photosystem II stability/assembly factor-like uncharacterized protein